MIKQKMILVVLGGILVKDKEGFWRTTKFSEGDNYGASGDYLRVYAACYLAKKNPASLIIVLGGRGQLKAVKDSPAVASIIKKELMALSIPKQKILVETKSGNTASQLWALAKILKEKKIQKINLISNAYHLPRIKAMIKYLPKLSRAYQKVKINFVAAEKVVLATKVKKWQKIIKLALKSPAFKRRIQLEKKGILDLKKGLYKTYD
jgi:phage pi2 protein 07